MSADGSAALRSSEGQVNGGGYYNDAAGNCTRGTGISVHQGQCSGVELARPADTQANEHDFTTREARAEDQVRQQVSDRHLTQPQFDALVSATYNLGGTGAHSILNRANQNDDTGVVRELRDHENMRERDANGHLTGRMVHSRGLEDRREREAVPFENATP